MDPFDSVGIIDSYFPMLELEKARIRWFLSINEETIPEKIRELGKRTFRSIKTQGRELDFNDGFTDLHTKSYEGILSGEDFPIGKAKTAIEIVHDVRHANPIGLKGDYHSLAK
jgi:UDP-N-acetyl-2-amino-2-deoxyglucuronate dehydrogenase